MERIRSESRIRSGSNVEAIPKNKDQVEITDINEQYLYEFLDALQSSINQMSADGMRISYVQSKSRELSKYMAETLDEDWKQTRGMEIQAVAIASLSYDDKSQELLNMRNQGAMLRIRPFGKVICRELLQEEWKPQEAMQTAVLWASWECRWAHRWAAIWQLPCQRPISSR